MTRRHWQTCRGIWAIARADFLERVRRYSFLFTLGFALYLGYLTISGNLVLQVGHVRGIFNSAWVGALLSLVASAFISLAGFYFVKNTIQRDRETRVGQILAATPLSKFIYVLGKVISNLAVLTLMIAVLALSGIAMQLVRGEDRHIEIWNLVAPFIFLAFPAMVVDRGYRGAVRDDSFFARRLRECRIFFCVDRAPQRAVGCRQTRVRPDRYFVGCG